MSNTTGAVSKFLNIFLENRTTIFKRSFQYNDVSKKSPITKIFATSGLISKAQKDMSSNKFNLSSGQVLIISCAIMKKIVQMFNMIKFKLAW